MRDIFIERGHPDLAAAVTGSRKYIRLRELFQDVLHFHMLDRLLSYDTIWRLRRSFLQDQAGPRPLNWVAWYNEAKARHKNHEGLLRVLTAVNQFEFYAVSHQQPPTANS